MTNPEQPLTTLIDELLAEQQTLTAVERFSQKHERDALPAQAKYYRDLIPLTLPQPGQQYAFEVDLDKCSGCKACVSACHSLNGLDDGETWREVGLLFSDDWRTPQQQTITTACHHCAEPGCLEGCPVLAYHKDPITGIVRHLDDQCIGCQYCVMKCPYDVPKYSEARGIVRKCDMCTNRLAMGEAPACAQACPNEAIRITIVNQAEAATAGRAGNFLPATPDPGYTLPTTRYKSAKPLPPGLLAGDHAAVVPSPAHLPLVFMLVLTQLAVGTSVAAVFVSPDKWLSLVAPVVGAIALNIASLHLGKPFKAWRAFLGWRTSWFSREVIIFGNYVPLAALSAASFWFSPLMPFQKPLAIAAAVAGLMGVVCSAMIYVDTRREFWRASQSFGKFLGTALLLGAVATLAATRQPDLPLLLLVVAATVVKLGFEFRIYRNTADVDSVTLSPLNKTARLLEGELGLVSRSRIAFGVIGGLVMPVFIIAGLGGAAGIYIVLGLCLVGELLERYLFFKAVVPVNMPGGVAS